MDKQKKVVIVGGSNGIGLALALELAHRGYFPVIVDKSEPDPGRFPSPGSFEYRFCDLLDCDGSLFEQLSRDQEVRGLMVTAGFGRAAGLEFLHPAEIRALMRVNAESAIQILRAFFERVQSPVPFFCGVMGSIAGWVSSPLFSVYAASKAALCRFVESVNVELEAAGTENRILNVSPGSFPGSRFNGGENDPALLAPLAREIADRWLARETLFIPDYEKTYRGVLERYRSDPAAFGRSSYQYKMSSGRVRNEKRVKVGYLSGTFDLFHIGHLNLLRRARQRCDTLIVGVHPNAAHKNKEAFIPFEERMAIVGACRYVDRVVESCREDSDAWEKWRFDLLFVGSDYKGSERFRRYEEFFRDKGVEIVYFPYTTGTSSTQIRERITREAQDRE